MNLEELLEELRENILRDTSDEVGHNPDSYLTDTRSLVRYIQDGVVKFAVNTLCIRDESTPAVTRVALATGVESYDLDPRVVAIFGARIGATHLRRTTYSGMLGTSDRAHSRPIEDWGRRATPMWFYTDRESGRMGVYPAPDDSLDGYELILRVARKPLEPLTAADLKAVPEIPEEYHLDVLEWAAWRALRNHDADLESMSKASAHKKRFNETVEELSRQAKRLLAQDVQFAPNSHWR
jgi:hypothetical protein